MCAVSPGQDSLHYFGHGPRPVRGTQEPIPSPDSGPSSDFPLVPASSAAHVVVSTPKVLSPMHWQKTYSNSPESVLWVSFHNFSATNFG